MSLDIPMRRDNRSCTGPVTQNNAISYLPTGTLYNYAQMNSIPFFFKSKKFEINY